jgi:hypothetical protein
MAAQQWKQLSPGTRRLIVVTGAVDLSLRVAALIDLARRPAWKVRGTKPRWAAALTLVNSAGVLPAAYFRWGRIG